MTGLPEYWDDFATIDDATPVALTNGQTLSGVDAELARGGSHHRHGGRP